MTQVSAERLMRKTTDKLMEKRRKCSPSLDMPEVTRNRE